MQKPIYTAAEEQALMTELWSPRFVNDPLAFVMFVYPWGQPGTPLEHFKGPRKWQQRVLRQMANHLVKQNITGANDVFQKAVSSGRGSGKSSLVGWVIDWFNTTRIGSTMIVSANSETQLRTKTWGEISKWTAMAIHSHWWEVVGITRKPAKWLCELVERDLKIGTRYWGAEGQLWSEENPDAYAGAHNYLGMGVIFDETSGIPDSICSVAKGFFTEDTPNRFWFLFGNMRRNTGYFFEAVFGAKREFWDADVIDTRTVEGTDKKVYQSIIDEYGEDSDEARVEVYGLPPKEEAEHFISPALVASAVGRKVEEDHGAPVTMGIDPAGAGIDWFMILVRQGYKILALQRFKITDDEVGTMEGVGHVINAIDEFQPMLTAIDETGLGFPIKNRLTEQGYKIRGVNFGWSATNGTRWGNKRAEIWGAMKDWLRQGSIPDDKRLRQDLIGPRKKPNSAGTMFLEGKKEMRARGWLRQTLPTPSH